MDIAAIPICMAGVLLIAKPSFLFGQHTDRHISHVGIIIGVAQVLESACSLLFVHELMSSVVHRSICACTA